MLLEDREAARNLGQMSAAISALEKIAKLHGLFTERRENLNREVRNVVLPIPHEEMTMEECEAKYCTEH